MEKKMVLSVRSSKKKCVILKIDVGYEGILEDFRDLVILAKN